MADHYTQGSTRLPFTAAEMLRVKDFFDALKAGSDEDFVDMEVEVGDCVVWSLEDFRPDVLGGIVHRVLADRPDGDTTEVVIEFAQTCSRARPGEFGGGAVHVTREGVVGGPRRFIAITRLDGEMGASVHSSEAEALGSVAEFLAGYGFAEKPSAEAMAAFVKAIGLSYEFVVQETRVC